MAMLKSLMIATLRDSTENETVWQLRRAFIDKNLNVNAEAEVKEHIIMLSHCFVDVALQNSKSHPPYVMEEVYQRSWGLNDDIVKAQHELESARSYDHFGNVTPMGTASNSMDSNALSVIPTKKVFVKKGKNSGISKKAMKRQTKRERRKLARQSIHPTSLVSSFVKSNTTERIYNGIVSTNHLSGIDSNAKNTPNTVCFKLISSVAENSTENANLSMTSTKISTNSNSRPTSATTRSSVNKTPITTTNSNRPPGKVTIINNASINKPPVTKTPAPTDRSPAINSSTSNNSTGKPTEARAAVNKESIPKDNDDRDEDLTFENLTKLSPILDMASMYTEMLEKGCSNPYADIKACATSVNQNLKCTSKAIVKPDGSKSISCHMFVSGIHLAAVEVPSGSSPSAARKVLAETALTKISLPYLRLINGSANDLQLEGSEKPFDEDEIVSEKPLEDVTTESSESKSQMVEKSTDLNLQNNTIEDAGKPSSGSEPLKIIVRRKFDSYVAWRKETNPILKMIRQLGHFYQTLPCTSTNSAQTLEYLAKLSGISLEMQISKCQGSCQYNFLMNEKILLFSCIAYSMSQEEARSFASKTVIERACMPFLCLKSNVLQAATIPFPKLSGDGNELEEIIYDVWHTECQRLVRKKNSEVPVRVKNFYLVRSEGQPCFTVLTKSVAANNKKLSLRTSLPGQSRLSIFKIDGLAVGEAEGNTKRKAKFAAAIQSVQNLRRCHWMLFRRKLQKCDKYITIDELEDFTPSSDADNNCTGESVLDSTNLGHRLLTKMGWTGGGMGRDGSGITEPIAVKLLKKKSGLGFQKTHGLLNAGNLSYSYTDSNLRGILESYSKSLDHRDLFIPHIAFEDSKTIQSIAHSLNLIARLRGKLMKRAIICKRNSTATILSQLLRSGGKSDLYELLPPRELDADINEELYYGRTKNRRTVETNDLDKCIQCSLLKAPPLLPLEDGAKTEIVWENNSDVSGSDRESEEEMVDKCSEEDNEEDDVNDSTCEGTLLDIIEGQQSDVENKKRKASFEVSAPEKIRKSN